jgi:galactitol-specific phosphotransferase system IIC component
MSIICDDRDRVYYMLIWNRWSSMVNCMVIRLKTDYLIDALVYTIFIKKINSLTIDDKKKKQNQKT